MRNNDEYEKYEIKYIVWDIPNLTNMSKQHFSFILESDGEECIEEYANEYLQQYFATGNYQIDEIFKK